MKNSILVLAVCLGLIGCEQKGIVQNIDDCAESIEVKEGDWKMFFSTFTCTFDETNVEGVHRGAICVDLELNKNNQCKKMWWYKKAPSKVCPDNSYLSDNGECKCNTGLLYEDICITEKDFYTNKIKGSWSVERVEFIGVGTQESIDENNLIRDLVSNVMVSEDKLLFEGEYEESFDIDLVNYNTERTIDFLRYNFGSSYNMSHIPDFITVDKIGILTSSNNFSFIFYESEVVLLYKNHLIYLMSKK